MKINVYCENKGWLFEDLKANIARHGATPSDRPIPGMDAYICIRDTEAARSPAPQKTVVQIHHTKPVNHRRYGLLSFVHPVQQECFHRRHNGIKSFVLPIGAREIPVKPFPKTPTLGYFCREVRGLKRSSLFQQAANMALQERDFRVLMIGENLESLAALGKYERRPALPKDYARITAFMTTSVSQMVPLSAYEALAAGRPLVTTPRQFPFPFTNIYMGGDAPTLKHFILSALENPELNPQWPFSRDVWARRQVEEARNLCTI